MTTENVRLTRRRAATRRVKDSPLSEEDWIEAANELLVRENVRGVKLERLCTKLGVTKGSFYWHFKKRSDLLDAMLTAWRRRMTLNIIQTTNERGGSVMDRIGRLLLLPRNGKARAAAAVEQSMRDWSRRGEKPLAAVREVDELRVNYFEQLFREGGFGSAEARRRGYLAYCMMMGDSILRDTVPDLMDDKDYVAAAVALLNRADSSAMRAPGRSRA